MCVGDPTAIPSHQTTSRAPVGTRSFATDAAASWKCAGSVCPRSGGVEANGFDVANTLPPVTAEPPPPLGQFVSPPDVPLKAYLRAAPFGAFTFPINLTGQPAISLPLHHTESGLPVGAMLTAAYGREDLLLRVAAQLEQAVPWRERRAPGYA